MQFSGTSLWSLVSILDLLNRFSFQFIKKGSAAMLVDHVVYKNGGQSSCKLKQQIYRKGAIQRTETERPFLAGKVFNNNLVQFPKLLSPYHVIVSNVDIYSLYALFPKCTDVHLKRFCVHEISARKIIIYEGLVTLLHQV